MHRLAVGALAGFALLAGCLKETVQFCKNGAFCTDGLVCTERTEEPFCGNDIEVRECMGKADEDPCMFEGEQKGYCAQGLCLACNPNLSFCRYIDEWKAMPIVIDGTAIAPQLSSVWVAGPKSVYVAGTAILLHWDGRGWARVNDVVAGQTPQYSSIWGRDETAIYVTTAGKVPPVTGTKLFRYDGANWTGDMDEPRNGTLNAVWATDDKVFVAGGLPSDGVAGHFNGSVWSYSGSQTAGLNGVAGTTAADAIAVGGGSIVVRYNGTWTPDATGTTAYTFIDVARAVTTDFVVGRRPGAPKTPAILIHKTSWSDMSSSLSSLLLGAIELRGVWALSENDAYAVGEGGVILHYDGSAWTNQTSGIGTAVVLEEIHSVTANGKTDVFAVGTMGTVLRLSR